MMIPRVSTAACWMLLCTTLCLDAQANNAGLAQPLAVGSKAINFELPIVGSNDYIELKEAYQQGPVVVVVLRGYPGYQCPLCSHQVSSIINRAKAISAAAARVILVYPGDDPKLSRHAQSFLGSRRLPDPIVLVRDDAMAMVTQWGLRWHSPRETAYPATYVIDKNGRVAWSKVSSSHADRSTTEEIMKALRKL
ncbi:Redoxin [Novipirellula galeiformis]|uniref:Redoxin n=1 Tax=Novipirellula galeiformis TaxID=2528004 RepID=A0A5C6CH12_9BACT|nr:redoxin family protein [Novipirellula galeiformis]TWU23482.1 Redoxin [Novipirellula galeiformis]